MSILNSTRSRILAPGRSLLSGKGVLNPPGRTKMKRRGQSGGQPPQASGLKLPQEANIIYRFDSSDISTLFQDTARTSPVTADEQNVLGWTNLGSRSDQHMTQHDASYYPEYDAAKGMIFFAGAANSNVMELLNQAADETGSLSSAMLGVTHGPTDGVAIVWEMNQYTVMGTRVDYTTGDMSVWDHSAGFSLNAPALVAEGGFDGPFSSVSVSTANDQEAYYSSTESTATNNGVHWDIPAASNMLIGANTDGGSNPFSGWIGEIVIWSNTRLTTAEVAEVAAYDTAKFGTVWT